MARAGRSYAVNPIWRMPVVVAATATGTAETGSVTVGLAAVGTAKKVAVVGGSCTVGFAPVAVEKKGAPQTGVATVGSAASAQEKKSAVGSGTVTVGAGGTGVESTALAAVLRPAVTVVAARRNPAYGRVKPAQIFNGFIRGTSAPLFGTIVDDFTSGLGAVWTQNSGTVSGTDGRARIQCDTGFSSIRSASIYKLTGSAAFARLTPPGWGGATTDANLGMSINSATSGTSLSIIINRYAGTIKFSSETGFFDASAVSLTYDPTAHAFCQLRESAGTTYWETSPSGKAGTWTTRKSISTPAWVGVDLQDLQFTAHRDAGTTDHAEVDYVNVVPTATGGTTLNLWKSSQPVDSYSQLNAINQFPHALWVGDWDPNPDTSIAGYATSAAGATMVLPIYAIPNRDSGGYSGGGFPDQASYLAWITKVKNGAGPAPVWYILEPDALGLAGGFSAPVKAERLDSLAQAVSILKLGAKSRVYIDASFWLTASNAASLLQSANIDTADGFATNVSAFETVEDCYTWCDSVITALAALGITGKKYVIDTGRAGRGKLTSAFGTEASPWVTAGKEYINPPGRGAGLSPRTPTGHTDCAALLWIKGVGGSDGNDPGTSFTSNYFGENAPGAGTFWVRYAENAEAFSDPANFDTGSLTAATPTAAERGSAAAGVAAAATDRKVAKVAGTCTVGTTGSGLGVKKAAVAGTAAVGLAGTRAGVSASAQGGASTLGMATTGRPVKVAKVGGTCAVGGLGGSSDKKLAAGRGAAATAGALTGVAKKAAPLSGAVLAAAVITGTGQKVVGHTGAAAVGFRTHGAVSAWGPPPNLTATPISTTQIDLSWIAVALASGYDIERNGVVIATDVVGTGYSDTGLTPATAYTYRARSVHV